MKKSVLALIAVFALAGFAGMADAQRGGGGGGGGGGGRGGGGGGWGGGGGGAWSGGGGGSHMRATGAAAAAAAGAVDTAAAPGTVVVARRQWHGGGGWHGGSGWRGCWGCGWGGAWWGVAVTAPWWGWPWWGAPYYGWGMGLSGLLLHLRTGTGRLLRTIAAGCARVCTGPSRRRELVLLPATRRLLSVRAKLHEAVGACRPQRDAAATLPAARLNATQGDVT